METTTTTVDIATAANYEANAVVERLLKRDQGMFDSAEVLAVLDLVDTAVSLATDADPAKLATLAEVSAAGRAKASGQPERETSSADVNAPTAMNAPAPSEGRPAAPTVRPSPVAATAR